MNKKTIGVFVGSLRRGSFSKKVAKYLGDLLSEEFEVKFMDISALAMYNEDLDNEDDIPPAWRCLRLDVKALDAVLFVTPEYNRSIPAVLKNALDVASRPKTDGAWAGKPGAVVCVSPGKIGAYGAGQHLRQTATCLDILMMQQPEAYVGGISEAVSADSVADKGVQDFLRLFADAFAGWINKLTA